MKRKITILAIGSAVGLAMTAGGAAYAAISPSHPADPGVIVVSARTDSRPYVTVVCPKSHPWATGGGAGEQYGKGLLLTSEPLVDGWHNPVGWLAEAGAPWGPSDPVTVYAICAAK